jgi:hypothetical protein
LETLHQAWQWLGSGDHAPQIGALSALLGVVLTSIIIGLNLWSAAETRRSLALARSQFAREWRVDLHLRLLSDNDSLARIEVTNLSKSSALLKALKIRREQGPPKPYPIDVPLRGGGSDTIPIGVPLRNFVDLQSLLPSTLQEIEELTLKKQLSEKVRQAYPSLSADMQWRDQHLQLALCLEYDAAGTESETTWIELSVLVAVTIQGQATIRGVEQSRQAAARS